MDPLTPSRPAATPRVFVVMAAFNEETVIESVVERLQAAYPNIVIVDDGSTDATAERLRRSKAHLLRHSINRGQGAALQTGIRFALLKGAEVIVTFDADGQHSEQDIDRLINPIVQKECEVTLGSRFLGRADDMPPTRRILLKAGILFTRIVSRIRISDVHNGLRAFSRRAAASLDIRMDRMAHASEILDQIRQNGWRYREIPVHIRYSAYSVAKGQSSWNALVISSQILFRKLSK